MDVIDMAQRRQMEDVALALAVRPAVAVGRMHCANADCRERIAEVRQRMGAQLCIDCQRAAERSAQPCARGAG